MSNIALIQSVIEGASLMPSDGLRDYHTARAIRDGMRCKGIQHKLVRAKHALNSYNVTVAADHNPKDFSDAIRLHNRVTGKSIIL